MSPGRRENRFLINIIEKYAITGDFPLVLVDAEKIGMKVHHRSAQVFCVLKHEGLETILFDDTTKLPRVDAWRMDKREEYMDISPIDSVFLY